MDAWENDGGGGADSYSSSTTTGGATAEIFEEQQAAREEETTEKVFVAVPEQHKSGKSLLAWTLRHIGAVAGAFVVVAHVHAPAQMIPMMGSKFHASKLRPEQVSAYRQYEREKVEKHLDEYIHQCSKMEVKCEKLVIENDDVAKGIAEIVSLHGVSKLIMGAAADKQFSRKMKMPKSKTALAVLQKADTSCKIWFVCKEHLICTREAGAPVHSAATPPASTSSISTLSEWGGQPNGYACNAVDDHIQRSMSEKVVPASVRTSLRLPSRLSVWTSLSRRSIEDTSVSSWDSVPRGNFPSSHQASSTVTDEGFSDYSSFSTPRHDASEIRPLVHVGNNLQNSPCHEQDAMNSNIDIFDKLGEASTKAENHQKQAFDESVRREKAEEEPVLFRRKANNCEDLSLDEAKKRKEVKEALAKANGIIERMKQEMDALKRDRDDIIDKLVKVSEQKETLEQQVDDYGGIVKDLEDTLTASKSLIHSQKLEYEKLKHERDNALKDADGLRKEKEKTVSPCPSLTWNTEFSLSELQLATQNFSDTLKVGEGGFGRVYRGLLRNTTVAIKMLRSHNLQGQSQFRQEVVVLSRVRHPNLVTLMGSCSEASGLVYEFLPNGSLEDRLACENNTLPLTWQVRTRIIGEICSALVFLHSNKPHPVIHGDLKPANILLDANLVSKLSDFGISCLLVKSSTMSTSLYQTMNPRGTFAYMDPEFLTTGELTARSDIYSLGIVILQLVTGKPALGIGRAVEDALEKDELELLVDQSAGKWPFVQAKKLMLLGLQCAELSRRRRPSRMSDVWCVIETLVKSASLSTTSRSFGYQFVESHTPSCFVCPISQEVMRNPHIAADGYTYEAEVIKGWLHSGRSTSPMTKLPLAHHHLIPNHALYSAIQEHFKQQQQQKKPPL